MDEDRALLKELSSKTYEDQAIWFLNAFWRKDLDLGNNEAELENIWNYVNTCVELDTVKQKEGCELDEFQAHRLLEKVDIALTVKDMREKFRQIDLDFNKRVSLSEFLIYKYNVDYKYLIRAPQGSADLLAQLEAAERAVEAAQASTEICAQREQEAREALREQKAAERELKAALEEIAAEERQLLEEKETYESKANDDSLGLVKRQKAAAELAQWKAKDPEAGVRRAKITQEAAVRKQQRATRVALEAQDRAEKARAESEQKFSEAKEMLEEIKAKSEAGQGKVWWMMRELEESKKYMSKKQRLKVEREQAAREARLRAEQGLV